MQNEAHPRVRRLLTARQVQTMLHVDRSTIYRMAEDGRLPAIKVGRQWRFPADQISALVAHAEAPAQPDGGAESPAAVGPGAETGGVPGTGGASPYAGLITAAEAVLAVSADLLGVMMVITDMDGHPLTPVTNPCDWFADRADDERTVTACSAEWQLMADDPDLRPRFRTGVLGFQCARAFIRSGSSLVGMVLAGGIAPSGSDQAGLYYLDDDDRERVLVALPKVAAALSRVPPRAPRKREPEE